MTQGVADPPPATTAGSGGVGPALKAARERRGLALAAVAEALHIDSKLIEAMEAGRFQVFDAPVYARGFIRKYGSYLELPVDDLIAAYDALAGGPAVPTLIPVTATQAPPRNFSKLTLPLMLVAALLVVGGFFWWWSGHGGLHKAPAAETVAMPASAASATDAAVSAPAAESAAATPAPPPAAPDVRAAADSERAPEPTRPAARPAARVAGPSAPLTLEGLRECWVEVYSPTGARLFYDLVKAGESHALPGPGPWRVFLGNADGVRLSLEQRPITVPAAFRAGATARFVVAGDGALR